MIDDPNSSKRQIVPTSDDEDIFFISQSSQDTRSLSRTGTEEKGKDEAHGDDADQDEDDDHEPVLSTRRLPRVQQQESQPIEEATTALGSYTIDQLAEPQTPPLPLTSASEPTPAFGIHTEQSAASGLPDNVSSSSPRPGVATGIEASIADDTGNIILRPSDALPLASQQSDATMPLVSSAGPSRQPSPTPSLVLAASNSLIPLEIPNETEQFLPMDIDDNRLPSPSRTPLVDTRRGVAPNEQARAERISATVDHGASLDLQNSPSPPLSPLRIPIRRHRPQSPSQPQHASQPPNADQTSSSRQKPHVANDEQLARAAAAQPPTPPRRQLRARNAAQLNPYTLEAMRYQRALIRNDWQDAVVSQREWHRQERKRLAEEAARAEKEKAAAQGSEQESQSQWLVPSSGPSSQADPDDVSLPSSPPHSTSTGVFVEIPAFTGAELIAPFASGSRPRRPSPSPSQSGRLPELSEMLAKSTKNRHNPGQNAPATYKGHRSIARTTAVNGQGQPPSVEESQISEEANPPLPPPTRRKHNLLALSPPDTEDQPRRSTQAKSNQEAVTVESSEDERPPPSAPKPRRRSRWSGDGSSSDSTDYERRFRQLKKMMPAGMARKHIRDLRAMRHGKAYHSDGHVSSSSSDGGPRSKTGGAGAVRLQRQQDDHASEDEELRPGQTRKRLRRHDSTDANPLLIDPDSDSSSSSSSSSVSSQASITITHSTWLDPKKGSEQIDEADEADEAPAVWWSVNRLDSYVPFRERDAIDRMLSRTGGRKASNKTVSKKRMGLTSHRQARLDGFVAPHRHRERPETTSRSHLREIDQNLHRRPAIEVSEKDVQQRTQRRKKKRRKLDPRVGRTTSSSTRQPHITLRNPPVVCPRVRPRLDLEQHDVLFASNPLRATKVLRSESNNDDAMDEEDASDDDGGWRDFGSIMVDSTPSALPDSRLAAPRNRTTVVPQTLVAMTAGRGDAPSTPFRGNHPSPSLSVASRGMERQTSMIDRSPGTPTRVGQDTLPQRLQARPAAGNVDSPVSRSGATTDGSNTEVWDDFEGISLSFGITPLAAGKNLDTTTSPIMARLSDLIALPDRLLRGEHVPRTWPGEVLRLGETVLTIDMNHAAMYEQLPFFMDGLRLQISRSLGTLPEADLEDNEHTRRHACKLIADTGSFLSSWIVQQLAMDPTNVSSIFASYQVILEKISKLQTSIVSPQDAHKTDRASRDHYQLVCLHLAWMRFEICWSLIAICDLDPSYALEPEAPSVEVLLGYARALISLLLHYGLHRCVKHLRRALAANRSTDAPHLEAIMDEEEVTGVTLDEPTSMWLATIHLLDSFEKGRGILDGRLYWNQFEAAFQRWDETMPKRARLLRSESLWYCLFACAQFSQVSPQGHTQAAPLLRECWSLVTRALNLVKFRSDESNETAMGWHMLAKRDAYVRIVLQRCCLLSSEWRWTMGGAEPTLARLFDIFNSHKLADLPTESGHDFPAFLRDFDTSKLQVADVADGEALSDPSFHLFVRLLARTGQELRETAADAKDGDRRISRLFSRMTSVRVMPFTRSDVPTRSQRSVLFNHYSVVMLFLHLVPNSSPQRLRQVQNFLPTFKEADFLSQVTYIRAMMYVAVIFRHHQVDLAPVTKWFAETITGLRREYEEIESTTKQFERQQIKNSLQHRGGQPSKADALRMTAIFENAPARQAALRRKEEIARLLVVALRSIQHVIRHDDLNGTRREDSAAKERLPDQLLLNSAWIQDVLEAQIALEPRIGQEVLKCIQTFLLARMRVLQPANDRVPSTTASTGGVGGVGKEIGPGQRRDEESQDSFAELFEAEDDFDFEDPLLARLLDGDDAPAAGDARADADNDSAAVSAVAERKKWDRSFAELIKTTISPSLFQLLSNIYHPDRRIEAASTGSVIMSLGVTERLTDPNTSHGGRNHNPMDRLLKAAEARQFVELVVDCWAGCADVLVTNGMREWSSYLGFGNESWKRIDDPIGRRDVGLRFLQNVITLDPGAVTKKEYEAEFVGVWAQTAVARVLSVQDVFTKSLIEVAGKGELLAALVSQWLSALVDLDTEMDLDTFTTHRQALLKATYTALSTLLTAGMISTGTVYAILSALLSSLRAYVDDAERSGSFAAREYANFCQQTLADVEEVMGGVGVFNSLKGDFTVVKRLVDTRLAGEGKLWINAQRHSE